MRKRTKIVKTYGASHKKRNRFIAAALAGLTVLGVIIATNIYDEYHTYHSDEATVFETVSQEKDGLILATETKKLLGKVYAGFSITDAATNTVVYQCPDLFLVRDLDSIVWGEDHGIAGAAQDSVAVVLKDGAEILYYRDGKQWTKQQTP